MSHDFHRTWRRTKPRLLALAMLSIGPSIWADPLFTSYSAACNSSDGPTSGNSLVSTSVAPTCGAAGTSVSASSFSGPRGLGGVVQARYMSPDAVVAFGQNTVSLATQFTLNGPAANADVGLALDISSSLLFLDPDTQASLEVGVIIGPLNRFGRVNSDGATVFNGISAFPLGGGLTHRIMVDPVNVPVGSPVSLSIQLVMTAQSNGHNRQVTLDAAHTLTFATTGPVFSLDPGFGVQDIPELFLQNNGYVPPAAVPEPGTFALLGAGLLVLTMRRRRA